jgi:hypothetical protein
MAELGLGRTCWVKKRRCIASRSIRVNCGSFSSSPRQAFRKLTGTRREMKLLARLARIRSLLSCPKAHLITDRDYG